MSPSAQLDTREPRSHAEGGARTRALRLPGMGSGVTQIGLLALALLVYMAMRVVVEGSPGQAHANTDRILSLERNMSLDWEHAIQGRFLDHDLWIRFWNGTYKWLYWPSVGGALLLLWHRSREHYYWFRNALIVAAALGIIIFGLFPVSPPRFLDGYVDTLDVYGQRSVGADSPWANAYAAVPSFHVGWPALGGAIVASSSRNPIIRIGAMLPAVLITGAVIVTGNHFILDVVAGLAVVWLASSIVRLRGGRPGATMPAPLPANDVAHEGTAKT